MDEGLLLLPVVVQLTAVPVQGVGCYLSSCPLRLRLLLLLLLLLPLALSDQVPGSRQPRTEHHPPQVVGRLQEQQQKGGRGGSVKGHKD